MSITPSGDIVQQILTDQPAFHLGGAWRWDAMPETLQAIRRLVRPGHVTLEVGTGVSTVIFAACGAQHTAVSPDPKEHQLIREYCQSIGVDVNNLEFVVGFSDDVLPKLLTRERNLDVALIDGAHCFPFPVIDWYYAARALKVGGKLLLDDVPIPATQPVFRHMTVEPGWRLDGILDSRAAEFTLLEEPAPGDDWEEQLYNSGYPDYSFAALPTRLRLGTEYRMNSTRRAIGRRFPYLREFYKGRFKASR